MNRTVVTQNLSDAQLLLPLVPWILSRLRRKAPPLCDGGVDGFRSRKCARARRAAAIVVSADAVGARAHEPIFHAASFPLASWRHGVIASVRWILERRSRS